MSTGTPSTGTHSETVSTQSLPSLPTMPTHAKRDQMAQLHARFHAFAYRPSSFSQGSYPFVACVRLPSAPAHVKRYIACSVMMRSSLRTSNVRVSILLGKFTSHAKQRKIRFCKSMRAKHRTMRAQPCVLNPFTQGRFISR